MSISRIISVATIVIPLLTIVGCDSGSTSNATLDTAMSQEQPTEKADSTIENSASPDTVESLPDSSEEVEALPDSTESPESSSSSKSPKSSNSEPPQSSNGAQDKSSNSVTPKSSNDTKSSSSSRPRSSNSMTISSEVITCGHFDTWYGLDGIEQINTGCSASGETGGFWYFFDDSMEGGKSYIEWPTLPGTAYDTNSLQPIIEECQGICGTAYLDQNSSNQEPFVGVAFDISGEVGHYGSDTLALGNASSMQGICVAYTSDFDITLEMSLGRIKDKELDDDIPSVKLPKRTTPTVKKFAWSDFKQGGWGRGGSITGEEAVKAMATFKFKIQTKDGSRGAFNIMAVGALGGQCDATLGPIAGPLF